MSCYPSPPSYSVPLASAAASNIYWDPDKTNPHLIPQYHWGCWSCNTISPCADIKDRTHHNVLGGIIILMSNVLLSRPHPSTFTSIDSPMVGYTHLPYGLYQVYFPLIWWDTRFLKPPSAQRMQGVTTHVSAQNWRIYCTTALKKVTDIFVSAPSRPRICDSYAHPLLHFLRSANTAVQSLSMENRILLVYLNDTMLTRVWP